LIQPLFDVSWVNLFAESDGEDALFGVDQVLDDGGAGDFECLRELRGANHVGHLVFVYFVSLFIFFVDLDGVVSFGCGFEKFEILHF